MTPENLKRSTQTFSKNDIGLIASLLLGDGCLTAKGKLVIAHGLKQTDYCAWKSEELSALFKEPIKSLKTREAYQIQVQRKPLQEYYGKFYPNKKKSIPQILKYITDPLAAIAVWVCDDGNVSPSIAKNGKCYSAAIQIFTFTDFEDTKAIADWFEKNTGLRPNIIFRDRSKTNRTSAYIIKFSAENTRQLYKLIQPYIPDLESMKYKFRYLNYNPTTRPLQNESSEKIV